MEANDCSIRSNHYSSQGHALPSGGWGTGDDCLDCGAQSAQPLFPQLFELFRLENLRKAFNRE